MEQFLIMQINYEGKCNDEATQGQVKTKFLEFVCGHCEFDKLEVYCGTGSLLRRRRKRNTKELTLKVSVVSKVAKDKLSQDPRRALDELKKDLETKIALNVISDLKSKQNWRSLNKYLASLSRISKQGVAKEKCTKKGEEQNDAEQELSKKCGKASVF